MNPQRSVPARLARTDRFVARPLVVLLAAVCGGIVLDRWSGGSLAAWVASACALLLAWWVLWWRGFHRAAAVLLLLAAASVGAANHHSYWRLFPADEFGLAARDRASPVCLEAMALNSPTLIPPPAPDPFCSIPLQERSRLTVRVTRVRDGQRWRPASGQASLLVDGRLEGCSAGDHVRVFAMVRKPDRARNPGQFDEALFRRGQRQLFELHSDQPESVQVVQRAGWWNARRWLYGLRRRCQDQLDRYVRHPQSELAAAVLLGARDELPRDRVEDFFLTGTIHLLAISGLHIGILACGLWWMLRLLAVERRWSLAAAAMFVVAYAVLTEARPPVTRAAILVVAFCVARFSGRRVAAYNVLAAAALMLLCFNPSVLFQVGPQLSFLAVATIAGLAPWMAGPRPEDPLERLIARSQPWIVRASWRWLGHVGSLAVVTTVIWLVALPLVMYHFHLVSPIAVLLNPIICIPMSIALFAGFGVLIFGSSLPPVASVCGWVCDVNLAALERTVQLAKKLECGYFWAPAPATWWGIGFYALLAAMVAAPRHWFPARWRVALLAAWLAAGFWSVSPHAAPVPRLSATFVSVGHGACTIVELPDGQTLLCDAGGMGVPTSVVRAISGCLWARGVTHLDAAILTHADADHYNALPGLLDRFSVGIVYVSPVMFSQPSEPLLALRRAIERRGIEIRELRAADRLDAGPGTRIQVWYPPGQGLPASDNANSLVLSVEHAGAGMLLTADIESPGLDDLLAEPARTWQLVSAPHHGSGAEQQAAFADWARPEWVVISGANPTAVRHVEGAYQQRGAQVLHTARDGAVRMEIDRRGVRVTRWQNGWRPP